METQRENKEFFSISSIVDKTGISEYTLRYYDKCGFFPDLARTKGGTRKFCKNDIEQLKLIDALRRSGLSIEGLQYFVRLQRQGVETLQERQQIIEKQRISLEYQLDEMRASLEVLQNAKSKV